MKRCIPIAVLAVLLFSLVPSSHAKGAKADAYFGYSRAGANLFTPNTQGLNGWQAAAHVKPLPFLGVEGDVSRFSGNVGAGSEDATLIMFGPRVTAGAAGVSLFGHGLFGNVHVSDNPVSYLPGVSYNAFSYAIGGGADIPLIFALKIRVTGDFLGNSKAPSSQTSDSPARYRIGAGLAYHF
jgi:hypothetical protein